MSVYIIAEAGVNHNGNIDMAIELVDIAVNSGADCVKFQTFNAKKIASQKTQLAAYQKSNLDKEITQQDMLMALELPYNSYERILKYCKSKNIEFLSTPFDSKSLNFLDSLGMEKIKIPSGEINNIPFLRQISKVGKPVILSTGMSNISDIDIAINELINSGINRDKITLLHCHTDYPTEMKDVNLKAMVNMSKIFGVAVGYSDHTLGIEVPIAAVALGAEIIEKHITIDRNLPGPDHSASIMPHEFNEMVSCIRNIEDALGDGIKRPTEREVKNMQIARKSIHASKKIFQGELFTEENLICKRPGTGISPIFWDLIIGTKASKNFEPDDEITL